MPSVIIPPTDVSPNTGTGSEVLSNSPSLLTPTLSVGATTSALTDLLINPTTKTSGNLIDAKVGGTSKFTVTKDGYVYFGPATASFPALAATGSTLTVQKADLSGYTNFTAATITGTALVSNSYIAGVGQISTSGGTTTGVTDLLINPTTKASGNLIDAQVNGSSKFSVTSAGYTLVSTIATTADSAFRAQGALACLRIGYNNSADNYIDGNNTYFRDGAGSTSGFVRILGTTASTSSTTGALVVSGGAGFAKNIYVDTVGIGTGGNAGSSNICIGTVNSLTTGSENTIISYGGGGGGNLTTGNSNTVVGFYAGRDFLNASSNNTLVGQRAGWQVQGSSNVMLGRYAGAYETGSNAFYVDNQDRTNTAGDKAKALLYGTFNATAANQTLTINAATTVSNTTASTSTSTGALVVSGGLGLAGALRADGSNARFSSVSTGFINSADNGVTGITVANTTGNVAIPSTTDTTGAGTGALQVSGGAYVGGKGWFGGVVTVPDGNQAAPGLRITSRSDTGLSYTNTNELSIVVAGEPFRFGTGLLVLGQWGGVGATKTIKGPSGGAGVSNRSGNSLIIGSGESTGNGSASSIILKTGSTGASGTQENALVTALTLDGSQNAIFAGTVTDSIGNVRSIPQNAQTSAYILAATDNGKHVSITTGGITVNSGIFSAGQVVTIYNNSSSNQTITQGASVTMYQAGTTNTGNRTLASYGVATVLCVASNTFVITGTGLS